MSDSSAVLAVTVIGDDRPGIIAELTHALAEVGGNLEDSTMTLLRGHFAMVVLVRTAASQGTVEAALAPLAASGELSVDVRAVADRNGAGGVRLGRSFLLR
ncbi:MAG TPA: ACT domain-containing protein, partial [Dermatophilaceae bacterium]|nr:ACT domain-containing protein [Dermatophilaceae bacterium]